MSSIAVSIRTIDEYGAFEIVSWSDGESCIGYEVRNIDGSITYDYLAMNRATLEATRHRGPTGNPSTDPQVT